MSPNNVSPRSGSSDVQAPLPAALGQSGADPIEQRAPSRASMPRGAVVELPSQRIRAKRRVRIHLGIIFALVASLSLWLLIRTLIQLAF